MKKTLIALALATLSPIAVQASESNGIGYNYVQLDYVYNDAPYGGFDSDGGALSGSYSFNDNVFGFASYSDIHGSQSKSRTWALGSGFNTAIGSRADWVTKVALFRSDWTTKVAFADAAPDLDGIVLPPSQTYRDHSWGGWVSTGVLGRLTDNLTANAYVGYQDVEGNDARGDVFADFGAVYSLNSTWGVHGGINVSEGGEGYALGVRASF